MTLKETIQNLKADIRRRKVLEGKSQGFFSTVSILFKGGVVSVILYRISHYLIHTRFSFLYRLLILLEHFYTKNEISPVADLGPGLVIADCGGVGITRVTIAGKNCTFLGANSITLGAMEGFDLEKDHILIGNDCVIGSRVRIIRPVQIADATQIKNNSVVMFSVDKPGSVISGFPAKRRSTENPESVLSWNPLFGGAIKGGAQ